MKEYPEEKKAVIKEYERFYKLYSQNKSAFETETARAIDLIISQAESEDRQIRLRELQQRWSRSLMHSKM
jgi:hypothetical protein